MNKLVFPGRMLDELAETFRQTELESFALVLAKPATVSKRNTQLLVQSIHIPTDTEYEVRSRTEVRPSAAFRLPLEKRARKEGLSLVYCHSHPAQRATPTFSTTDTRSEKPLATYAAERVSGVPHAALLVGAEGIAGRELGSFNAVEVWQIGRDVRRFFPTISAAVRTEHDRQVRAFGKTGQLAIQSLRIAVIGCGGTGSIVAQELAHLGATNVLLVDPRPAYENQLEQGCRREALRHW